MARLKDATMGYIIPLKNREHFIAAIGVLNELPGTWSSRGPAEAPVLYVTPEHYDALVDAGVVKDIRTKSNGRGKKKLAKKSKS
jgi:hypothetical protein